MAKYAKPVEFKDFDGLRNNTARERLKLGDLQVALNVDIDDAKRLTRRGGRVLRLSGDSHSLFSDGTTCLVVQGTTLYRVRAAAGGYVLDALRTGLTADARLSCWSVNDVIYYSNAFENGVVQANASRTWGMVPPIGQPGAVPIGGSLPAGRYQYALTYLRNDGQESGTGIAASIDLAMKGGIRFTSIPSSSDPAVTEKVIYMSGTSGEQLYRALVLPAAATSGDYMNNAIDLKVPLRTQFGEPPPLGHLVSYFNGHTLVAVGNVLYRSEPYRHELFMFDRGFHVFAAAINLIAPVEDGVFIGADQTYFLAGNAPEKWQLITKADYGAIPHTIAYREAEGAYAGEGLPGLVAFWASPKGHCVGANGGSFKNLTEPRYSYPSAERGAAILRQVNGYNQYLAVLEGVGTANNAFEE